jgi:hypothetical protein
MIKLQNLELQFIKLPNSKAQNLELQFIKLPDNKA